MFEKALTDHLPPTDEKLIVAVSGGCDSVCLLHWLVQRGFQNLVVCHVDHGLRPDSAADAEFVRDLADRLHLPTLVRTVDVQARMKLENLSLETAARLCRHDIFAACASEHRTPHIALGHHADDQAETILFNLLRGSHGLKGMRPISSQNGLTFHRPLLAISRADIRSYATTHTIDFREDSTNAQPIAARNRLRNEAIPLLSDILGRDITSTINRAAASTSAADQLDIALWLDPQGRLHLPTFSALPVHFQKSVLHRFLQLADIPELTDRLVTRALAITDPAAPPRITLPGGATLRRKEARLFIAQ